MIVLEEFSNSSDYSSKNTVDRLVVAVILNAVVVVVMVVVTGIRVLLTAVS